jgi:histidyl-tRNA synthetase
VPNLVRGLDYYTKTVFEVTSGELGAQNAIGAGGRYDGLTKLLGGPDLPTMGFAAGIERIIQTMLAQGVALPKPDHPHLYLVPLGDQAKEFAFTLTYTLRRQNVAVELDTQGKKVGRALEKAVALGATYALVLGDDEMSQGKATLKKLATREEIPVELDQLEDFLLENEST